MSRQLENPSQAGRTKAARHLRLAVTILCALSCLGALCATANLAQASLTLPAAKVSQPPSSFLVSGETVVKVRADETMEKVVSVRIKVLGEAALQNVGQQSLSYYEGSQTLDILDAHTEKADGRKIRVAAANIMTRDAGSGMAQMFLRDLKTRTVIFPDVAVGDTIVMSYRLDVKSNPLSGHFSELFIYPRELPFEAMKLRIEAPRSVALKFAAVGEGIEHRVAESRSTTTHLVTYRSTVRVAAEAGETSALDRDPRVLISTFRDYEDLGKSWLKVAGSRAQAVTPEIKALADEITKGIADRRAQAEAIDRWVKRNIRYVAVYLGVAAGWIPNEPADILKNRYGDCKDQTTLMAALLAAKGIASESVIIHAGNVYTLPEVATQAYQNHMIIYLPEFKLYDDPTVSYAAFGVLGEGDYDKPVVRMSARGVQLDRTPAMRPEDHATINRTRLVVAADGTVSGETTEINTGIFAMGLRGTVAAIQHDGAEKSAENYLRIFGTPGRGQFEIGSPSDLAEPFSLRSKFTLETRMSTAPGSEQAVPFGLSTRVRPGGYLFGRRLEGRKLPFVCYAGRQVEEIDLTFAGGMPLPAPITGRKIENRLFSYTSEYRLEDRTLKIRRELVSRVTSQVCAPEVEATLADAMKGVLADLGTRIRMPAAGQQVAAGNPAAPVRPEPGVDVQARPRPVRTAIEAEAKPALRVEAAQSPPGERSDQPPAPGPAANRSWCAGAQDASPDLRVHGCTAIIQSGRETPLSLGVAFANRGHAFRLKGEYGRAIQDFDQAIRLVPNYAAGFNGRGLAWHSLRNYERAMADFSEAIRLDPVFAAAFVNRGNVHRDTGAADRAVRDFDQAIGLDPTFAFGYLSRGRAYRTAGDYDRALADFDQTIRLQRTNAVAWNERCYTQTVVGRTAEALDACNESLKLRPNDRYALDNRGFALLKLDEYDRAIADYDAALRVYPREPRALYGRGVAKLRKGDVDGANADMAAARAIRPEIAQEFARHGLTVASRADRTSAARDGRGPAVTQN